MELINESSENVKKPKILSTIGAMNTIPDKYQYNKDKAADTKSPVFTEIKRDIIVQKPEAVQRNKRLFGVLMGHLGTATTTVRYQNIVAFILCINNKASSYFVKYFIIYFYIFFLC